jgi:hypothetical protein
MVFDRGGHAGRTFPQRSVIARKAAKTRQVHGWRR